MLVIIVVVYEYHLYIIIIVRWKHIFERRSTIYYYLYSNNACYLPVIEHSLSRLTIIDGGRTD